MTTNKTLQILPLLLIIFLHLIFNSVNTFTQWQQIYQANSNVVFADIHFVNLNTGFVTCNDSAIYKTTNSGQNWFALNSTSNFGLFNIQFTSVNTGFAVGNTGFSNGQFLRTTNSGSNWQVTQLLYFIYSVDFIDDNTGYLSDDNGMLHKTTNGGLNWVNINIQSGTLLNFVDFIDINTGFVIAGANQKLFITSNGGINWQSKSSPDFYKVQFLNYNTGFGYTFTGINSVLYKTTNNGNNWFSLFQPDSFFIVDIYFLNENTGWVTGGKLYNGSAYMRKVYKTYNAGLAWYEQNTGYVSQDTSSCTGVIQMLDSLNGFIASGYCQVNSNPVIKSRIYKTTNGGGAPIGLEPQYSNIPVEYKLHQNYPNPFNPVTKISFEIPKENYTVLTINDITGKLVTVLFAENLMPGKYETEWNAGSISSGVYFYTFKSGEFTATKKMLIIK